MKMNEIYEAPMLEVLNVAVEAGFEASANSTVNPPTDSDVEF